LGKGGRRIGSSTSGEEKGGEETSVWEKMRGPSKPKKGERKGGGGGGWEGEPRFGKKTNVKHGTGGVQAKKPNGASLTCLGKKKDSTSIRSEKGERGVGVGVKTQGERKKYRNGPVCITRGKVFDQLEEKGNLFHGKKRGMRGIKSHRSNLQKKKKA